MGPTPKRGAEHATGGGGTPAAQAPFAASTWEARQFAGRSGGQQAGIFTVFLHPSFFMRSVGGCVLEAAAAPDTLRCKASAGFAQRVDATGSRSRTPDECQPTHPMGHFPQSRLHPN